MLNQLTQGARRLARAAAIALLSAVAGCGGSSSSGGASPPAIDTSTSVGHVFIIVLENEDGGTVFGTNTEAPYLAQTLTAAGAYLPNYYGIGHNSLPNYIAMISGQAPNLITQADCQKYSEFQYVSTDSDGQAIGEGCIFPKSVKTLADQMNSAGLNWKGYMEDMGNDPTREAATCGHPTIGAVDNTQDAEVGDQYATRHDPFMYFHSIIDDQTSCDAHVVNLTALSTDLQSESTTANLTFITPNLCHDGHDSPCVDGEPGGLISADAWLQQWVPLITASPAFQKNGLLLILFDESGSVTPSDSTACCNEQAGPNSPLPGIVGAGGGITGAVALSPFITGGTVSTQPYNHYSTLLSLSHFFKQKPLGFAGADGLVPFGTDIFTASKPDNL